MSSEVPSEYQGNLLCINPEEQCFLGQEPYANTQRDKRRDLIFRSACKERSGGVIRCCPVSFVNNVYNPGPLEVPHMVRNEGIRGFSSCPENVKAACYRQTKRDQPLCIQEACNDAGYRVASNYYEVCKATQLTDKKEDVPECPTKGCWGNRFRIPEELTDELQIEVIGEARTIDGELIEKDKITVQGSADLEKKRSELLKEIAKLKAERDEIYEQLENEKARLKEDKLSTESFDDQTTINMVNRLTQLQRKVTELEYELDEINKILVKQVPTRPNLGLSFDFLDKRYHIKYSFWTIIISLVIISIILLCMSISKKE